MVKSPLRRTALFKKRECNMPDYTVFLNLLSLYDNKFSNKLMAHIPDENLRIVLFSLQDHLKFITEDIYNKLCTQPQLIEAALQRTYHLHSYDEYCTIWHFIGVKGCTAVTQKEIAKYIGVSKTEISRRLKKVSATIRKCVNNTVFPEIQLPEIHTDVSSSSARTALYNNVSTEPSYEDLQAHLSAYKSPFNRDSLELISNRGLRAAVGTFKTASHLFTSDVYESLLKNRDTLEILIVESLNNCELIDSISANYYKSYWQLGEFRNVKMTAETIAEYGNSSVTTIRRKIHSVSEDLRSIILSVVKRSQSAVVSRNVCEPLHAIKEKDLINRICKTFKIQTSTQKLTEDFLQVLGSIFQYYSLKVAVTARCLLNGGSYDDARNMLIAYGIKEDVKDGTLRSRKNRFLKSLREDYQLTISGSRTFNIKIKMSK